MIFLTLTRLGLFAGTRFTDVIFESVLRPDDSVQVGLQAGKGNTDVHMALSESGGCEDKNLKSVKGEWPFIGYTPTKEHYLKSPLLHKTFLIIL